MSRSPSSPPVATDTAAAPGDVPTADLDAARAPIVERLKRMRENVLAELSASRPDRSCSKSAIEVLQLSATRRTWRFDRFDATERAAARRAWFRKCSTPLDRIDWVQR